MPWTNQGGGGGKGPWGPSGGPQNQPDLEDLLKRGKDKLKQVVPGGSGLPPCRKPRSVGFTVAATVAIGLAGRSVPLTGASNERLYVVVVMPWAYRTAGPDPPVASDR